MALKLNERYPGRFNNPSADYPQGYFKNRTTPTAKDGSYLEQDWANDKEGFFQSLIAAAAITPNGAVDKVGASQMYDALVKIIGSTAVGRRISTRVFTSSGTISITPGATRLRVRMWAGGGQGGGTAATSASQVSVAGGGSAGSYAEAEFDVTGVSTASLVIGAGGSAGAAAANGAAGGSSTLTIGVKNLTCPGGPGGGAGAAVSALPNEGGVGGAYSASPTHTGALSFFGTPGGGATSGIALSLASAQPGIGGSSGVGFSRASSSNSNAVGYGSAGSGARSLISTGANNGPAGTQGLAIIEEYA